MQIQGVGGFAGFERMASLGGAGQGMPTGSMPPFDPEQMQAKFKAAAAAQGVDTSALAGLEDTIRSKVQETMQNGGSFDDVRSAIDGVLKENGIDPQRLQEQMQAAQQDLGNPGGGRDAGMGFGGSLGSASLLGVDLMKLLDGETTGVSIDRRA
jgi:hypothetical protein